MICQPLSTHRTHFKRKHILCQQLCRFGRAFRSRKRRFWGTDYSCHVVVAILELCWCICALNPFLWISFSLFLEFRWNIPDSVIFIFLARVFISTVSVSNLNADSENIIITKKENIFIFIRYAMWAFVIASILEHVCEWLDTRNTRWFMYIIFSCNADHQRWSRRVRQNKVSFYNIFNARTVHRPNTQKRKKNNENGMLDKTHKRMKKQTTTPPTTWTRGRRRRKACDEHMGAITVRSSFFIPHLIPNEFGFFSVLIFRARPASTIDDYQEIESILVNRALEFRHTLAHRIILQFVGTHFSKA